MCSLVKNKNWQNHENHVASIYRSLGYKVTPNININGQQADILCEKMLPGAGKTVLYVECKYSDAKDTNSVSKDTVNTFICNFISLKNAGFCTFGVMVSNLEFTQHAKSAAKGHIDVELKTLDDLYSDLFMIDSYLNLAVSTYENERIFSNYVPLRACVIDDLKKEDYQPTDMLNLFNDFMQSGNRRQLCLLGDFGAGKTTFMQYIHYRSAKSFLTGASKRMPLLIQLRDYYDVKNSQELIERFFSYELAAKVPYNIFVKFMEEGRFLILLDGFDEMGVVADVTIRRKNYLKLCQLIVSNSKLVITCRPTYFVSNRELIEVFGFFESQIQPTHLSSRCDMKHGKRFSSLSTHLADVSTEIKSNLLKISVNDQANLYIAQLQLLNEQEIKLYLTLNRDYISEKSDGLLDETTIYDRIQEIYDLEDLARRPILLKLIVKTLPLLRKNSDGKYSVVIDDRVYHFDDITPSILYHIYTEGELTREYQKGEIRWQVRREERRAIISRLAWYMLENDTLSIEPNMISEILHHVPDVIDKDMAQFTTDIRTCSFLTVDRYDSLRFAHKSFMEYFASLYVLGLIKSRARASDILGQITLPSEIFYFLGDSIGTFYTDVIKTLNDLFAADKNAIINYNVLNILNYARHPIMYIDNVNIQSLYYIKQNIKALHISNCILYCVKINKCEIKQLTIEKSDIDKIEIIGSKINLKLSAIDSDCIQMHQSLSEIELKDTKSKILELTRTHVTKANIINSVMRFASCNDSKIISGKFVNSLIMASDPEHFDNCSTTGVIFDDCIFLLMHLSENFLTRNTFKDCTFLGCYIHNHDILNNLPNSKGYFIGNVGYYYFREGDLRDPISFLDVLLNDKQHQTMAISQYIWQSFDEHEKENILNSRLEAASLEKLILCAINKQLAVRELYDLMCYAKAEDKKRFKKSQKKHNSITLTRENRILLSQLYSKYVQPVKVANIESNDVPHIYPQSYISQRQDAYLNILGDDKRQREKRLQYLRKQKWETVLAIIFTKSHMPTIEIPELEHLRLKIRNARNNLKALLDLDENNDVHGGGSILKE